MHDTSTVWNSLFSPFYYVPVYDDWQPWSPCTRSCDGGSQERRRLCLQGDCSLLGPPAETRNCNTQPCGILIELLCLIIFKFLF